MNNSIKKAVYNSLNTLFGEGEWNNLIVIEKTKKDFKGDLTLVCFPLLKWSKTTPENTAKLIGEFLIKNEPYFEDFNVVKGFLNLEFKKSYWLNLFQQW